MAKKVTAGLPARKRQRVVDDRGPDPVLVVDLDPPAPKGIQPPPKAIGSWEQHIIEILKNGGS